MTYLCYISFNDLEELNKFYNNKYLNLFIMDSTSTILTRDKKNTLVR
jgi:hypothetical protein